MKYQIVLQWGGSSIEDYDALIEVENLLIEKLSGANEVDGHDAGSDEVNIFIDTNDPIGTFNEVRDILDGGKYWVDVKVAYRDFLKSDYIIVWPKGMVNFKVT